MDGLPVWVDAVFAVFAALGVTAQHDTRSRHTRNAGWWSFLSRGLSMCVGGVLIGHGAGSPPICQMCAGPIHKAVHADLTHSPCVVTLLPARLSTIVPFVR